MPGPSLAPLIVGSGNTNVEVSVDGGKTWLEIHYSGDISSTGGAAPSTDVITFKGVGQISGRPRPGTLSIALPSYAPNLNVNKQLRGLANNQTVGQFRFTTQRSPIGSGMAAIATTGVVTFDPSATPDGVLPGTTITIAGTTYTIDRIYKADQSDEVAVFPAPAAAVTKGAYTINIPSLRLGPFAARVSEQGNFDLAVESNLTGSLTITPLGIVPAWTIVTT